MSGFNTIITHGVDNFIMHCLILQMGVSKGKTSIDELKNKFIGVVKEVGVPVQVNLI